MTTGAADASTTDAVSTTTGGAMDTTSGATTEGSTSAGSTTAELRPDLPPPCEPTTCRAAGKTCGEIEDGCGDALACGECDAPDTCGGGGVDNVCGHPCVPVRVLLFDLGDTLVESDGGEQFVERPGVNAMIAELKGLGMRVGIVTNVPDGYTMMDLEDLLVNPGFLAEFEVVLMSSEAMASPKPDPAIYVEAHALLLDPPPISEVAYVSENLAEIADQAQAPTLGARAAGLLGVHLSAEPPSPLADYTLAPDPAELLVELAESEWLGCAP